MSGALHLAVPRGDSGFNTGGEDNNSDSGRRAWALGLCDCISYRDSHGNSRLVPDFCPFALLCTNITAGRAYTRVNRERPICCGLGQMGALLCVCSSPLMCLLGCGANSMRDKVKSEYSVSVEQEEVLSCCTCFPYSWQPTCCYLSNCVCYPCSYHQILLSMEQWDYEGNMLYLSSSGGEDTPTPIANKGKTVTIMYDTHNNSSSSSSSSNNLSSNNNGIDAAARYHNQYNNTNNSVESPFVLNPAATGRGGR